MSSQGISWISNYIWGITDDVLRDLYVRGKYRDVILPMTVLRRLDAVLEKSKQAVIDMKARLDEAGVVEQDQALRQTAGEAFYNVSKFTMRDLKARASQQQLRADFEDYLDGFSPNVQDILENFEFRNQIPRLSKADALGSLIEKLTSPDIDLSPSGIDNHGMGSVFEELVRKFNEENNEEAGEHFTPREVIHLMTHLVFDPMKDQLPPIMTIYDPACGSGGMLTEAQNYIKDPDGLIAATGDVYLYGKEINDETYAICKSDMMIKGNNPENIKVGSTLSTDEFSGQRFDFMLSNPPYGKSWSSELKYIKDGKDVIDPRFQVELTDYWGAKETVDATPRSSDGQLLFLMEMVSKIKSTAASPIGSRIASIHNGSSLFTGDAGSGESNIRRFIIENDMLDTIIQLPNNLFYNTGITTYIWLLSNAKPEARRGKVQLIDANLLFRKLRKNLGDKNCEFSPEQVQEIIDAYLDFASIEREIDGNNDPIGIAVKVFDNADFGYHKVTIERPDRRRAGFTAERLAPLRFDKSLREPMEHLWAEHGNKVYEPGFLKSQSKAIHSWCEEQGIILNAKQRTKLADTSYWVKLRDMLTHATSLMSDIGTEETNDFNAFRDAVTKAIKERKIKLSATEKNAILNAVSWYDETAEKVIGKVHKLSRDKLDDLTTHLGCAVEDLADFGYYRQADGTFLTYEANTDLRDAESVPLTDSIHRYFGAEVKPHVDEAWINLDSVKIGYEISFNKYFYRHKPLRSLEEVTEDILALEEKADGLIADILGVEMATKLESVE